LFTDALELDYDSFVRDKGDLDDLKKSLEMRSKIPRYRFDYVIGNPPYVGYNECSKQNVLIVKLIKDKGISMGDIYGVNLNTVPDRIKPYSPKPNLYSFFIALGLALLKDNGKFCYIIPQNILTANDLDVIRYHLAKFIKIEKIFTFEGKMFIGRGILQTRPVPTSSVILVLKKSTPNLKNKIEVINYKCTFDSIEKTLYNISNRKNIKRKVITQNELLQNIGNWNFIKYSKLFMELFKTYKMNSIDISIYRMHFLNKANDFTFDGGVIINEKDILSNKSNNTYEIFDYKNNNWDLYTLSKSFKYCEKSTKFKFPSGSQGITAFNKKYKIIWRTRFAKKFQFTDRDIVLINNQSLIVSSNSKEEIMFYFALTNSGLVKIILEKNLKQPNEKDFFVPLRGIKSYVRIPNINNHNIDIKKEIISSCELLINMESICINEIVDFSKLLFQKFDNVYVKGKELVIEYKGQSSKCKITGDISLVEKCIEEFLKSDLFKEVALISDLKQIPAYDVEYQAEIKDYIDDLVFALYFKIDIPKLGFENRDKIKKLCEKNKYYKLIENVK
jgi:hypothetical protein